MHNDERDLPVANVPEPQDERINGLCDEQEKWKPSQNEALREFEIKIKFLNRGCVVTVGCKQIAFQNPRDAVAAINDYVINPYGEQQRWLKILD